MVGLGGFAWQALWPVLADGGYTVPKPRPRFAHGAKVTVHRRDSGDSGTAHGDGRLLIIGCYHPSQQNTFTGRVTPDMMDEVFNQAREAAAASESAGTACEASRRLQTEPGCA
jgi:uracil-DNA glycosylase